jgi:malate dehydrogenase (oxaloacetate-decarboxylating)
LLDLRVKNLGEDILVSVAVAIADMVDSNNLKDDYVIPKVNDPRLIRIVSDTFRDAIGRHIEKKKFGR